MIYLNLTAWPCIRRTIREYIWDDSLPVSINHSFSRDRWVRSIRRGGKIAKHWNSPQIKKSLLRQSTSCMQPMILNGSLFYNPAVCHPGWHDYLLTVKAWEQFSSAAWFPRQKRFFSVLSSKAEDSLMWNLEEARLSV